MNFTNRWDNCGNCIARRVCVIAFALNVILLFLYVHVTVPKLDTVLYKRQKEYEPHGDDITSHHKGDDGGAHAALAFEEQHGGGGGNTEGGRRVRSDGTIELFNDHNTRQRLISDEVGGGDTSEDSDGAVEIARRRKKSSWSLPFEELVSHIIEHDREGSATLGTPLSRYSRSRFRKTSKSQQIHNNTDGADHRKHVDNLGGSVIHEEAEKIAMYAAQYSPVAYVELDTSEFMAEAAMNQRAVAFNLHHSLVPKPQKATTTQPPSENEEGSDSQKEKPLLFLKTHHRKVRRGPPRVLVPPQLLLAFTLNATIPLIYEYRNQDDVIVRKRNPQRIADGLETLEDSRRGGRHTTTTPPSSSIYNEQLAKHNHSVTSINSSFSATAPTMSPSPQNVTNYATSDPRPLNETTTTEATLSSTSTTNFDAGVYFELEGRDFITGRRYFGEKELQKALSDQIYLLHKGWLPHAITGARGGALDGSNGGSYTKTKKTKESNPSEKRQNGEDRERGKVGTGRHISSSADLTTLTAKQLRYFTQTLFLEAIVKIQLFTENENVAVFGSLETPALEVALLTVGGAKKVVSVDYRPILCADERVVGYQLREFWELHERKWGKSSLSSTTTSPSLGGATTQPILLGSDNENATVAKRNTTMLEQIDHFTFRLKKQSKQPPSSLNVTNGNVTNGTVERRPHITAFKPTKYPPEKFNVIVAFGSVQHDGLGRYGDPLDPFGDIHAVSEMWSLLPFGGLLVLSVPVGNDCLVYNMFRVYGRRRLPLLLFGWDVVEVYGLDDRYATELYYSDAAQNGGSDAASVQEEKAASSSIFAALSSALGWFSSEDPRSRERQQAKEAMSVSPLLGAHGGERAGSSLRRRRKRVSRFTDSQCRGDLRYSPIFVLRKIPTEEAMRRKWGILAKVPGLLDGGFPLHHRPR